MRIPNTKERAMRALRQVLLAGKSLVSDDTPLPVEAFNVCEGETPWVNPETPQDVMGEYADVVERRYQHFSHQDWRTFFSEQLAGKGLEIGALHRPLPTHSGMLMDYADRLSLEDLRKHYPELRELDLVRPTIISDAETLSGVDEDYYDFLVSAHLIEHMRDPIGAIESWARVVRPGGFIYLIVPDKRGSFDRFRSRTLLEHLILDYRNPSPERDFAHYIDYSVLVHSKQGDEALDDAAKLAAEDYSIHYHVFIPSDILAVVEWMSQHVVKFEIAHGPCASPGSDEFHLLLKVGDAVKPA